MKKEELKFKILNITLIFAAFFLGILIVKMKIFVQLNQIIK